MADLIAKLLPIGLMLMMLVVGLRLQPPRLRSILRHPKALVVGLAVQVLVLPLLAYGIGVGLGLTDVFLTGCVLAAAAPGGVTSNYIAHLVRADLGLSVTMTLVTTALVSLTLPAVLVLTGQGVVTDIAALARICGAMGLVTLVPLLIGLGARHWRPVFADRALTLLEPIAGWVFAAMVLATFYQSRETFIDYAADIGPAMVLLNLAALAVAGLAGALAGLSLAERRAISVEASLQNIAVVLFVAGSLLGDPALAVPGLIYAAVMNVTAVAHIVFARFVPAGFGPGEA